VWKQAKAECGSRTEALQKIEIPWNPLAAVNHKNKRNAIAKRLRNPGLYETNVKRK